ncbi:MAG: hypothetical protein IJW31_01475 [Lentisphaeria bacterium]|nr:hypothetical protein [Lentisphaeria bacterium]
MKKYYIILLVISTLFLSSGCTSAEIEIIQSFNNHQENSPLYFLGGRDYECRLYRKGNHYYLESQILQTQYNIGYKFEKYLGKNIKLYHKKLFLKDDGRMYIKYMNNKGEKCESSVPFGDIYGDTPLSQMRRTNIFRRYNGTSSEKYGVAGIDKDEEPIIEAFLPTLQEHIRNDDAEAISKMFIYPIEIDIFCLENRQDFLKYYPQIFTEELKNYILTLKNENIFCNYKGLMLDSGMWFYRFYGKVYFYTFWPCGY